MIWKKELLAGNASVEAAAESGGGVGDDAFGDEEGDAAVEKRYGDPKFFLFSSGLTRMLRAAGEKHEGWAGCWRV